MVLQNNIRAIIEEVGKEFGLDSKESHRHYLMYIEEFILKNLYEADFDILRIEGLGTITPSLIRSKKYYSMLEKSTIDNTHIKEKVSRHIRYIDELNETLKKKKLYR